MATSNLSVYYQNTRGLRTKTHIFKRNLLLSLYDIVSLTETWLLEGVCDSELFDERYVVWRRDRNYVATGERYGGGVLLAVRREYAAVEQPDWRSTAEDIWVTITLKNNSPVSRSHRLHVCTLYLCKEKSGNSFNTQLQNFTENLSFIVSAHPQDAFLIMGDFNLSHINWSGDLGSLQPSGINGESQVFFFDTLSECDLNQYNLNRNANNRLLDYILCNYKVTVTSCTDPLVPEDSHHKSLDIVLDFTKECLLKSKTRLKYYYNKADYGAIKTFLNNINWQTCLNNNTLEDAVQLFYKHLYDVIEQYVPHKLIASDSFPPWYCAPLKKLLKEKFKFLKKFQIYGNTSDHDTFCLLRDRAKRLEKECYLKYIKHAEDAIIKCPKSFWSFIKSNKKGSNSLPSTIHYNGVPADTGDEICDVFASHFHSNFLPPSTYSSSIPMSIDNNAPSNIGSIEVTADLVLKLLKSLDLSKGAGPDNVVPLFIVSCATCLTEPLVILYKRSISEGLVPKIWKSAFITPIHKSGSKSDAKNYRPISKLCIFAKILEKIVYTQVYESISPTLITEQHGFVSKRSTLSNLLSFTEFTTSSMDAGGQVDAIFTDYSKAFDRIDHKILLQKLLQAGIHGDLYRWFVSYIENRSQAVVLNGYRSKWSIVPSGVPQGSLLGPLLFNIFINDVTQCIKYSQLLLYADDMKIFKKITSFEDCQLLQNDLDSFEQYCLINKLDLNVKKCFFITFTRKVKIIKFKYFIKRHELEQVDSVRDLGVIHDSKLTYERHVDHIVKKAYRTMGFVLRASSQFSNLKVLKILYCSLVRSVLEYCSQVWNPLYNVYIDRIESIQRRFLKHLQHKSKTYDPNYEARCRRHHILPLYQRRKFSDIACLVKIAQNHIDSPDLLSRVKLKVPNRMTRRKACVDVPQSSSNYRQNSFFVRSAREFNKLVDFPELDLFNSKPRVFNRTLTKSWFGSLTST